MYNDWFTVFGFTIHGYGVMIGLGFVAAMILSHFRAKKRGLPKDTVPDLVLLCIVAGFAGGKLLYIIVELFSRFDRFQSDFWGTLWQAMGSSGFVVYGGLILALLAAMVYCRVKKLSFLECFDMAAPAVALAQCLGRMGCFFAGCCYGQPTDAWWGITFPQGSFAPAGQPLIPVQLICAAGNLLLALLLLLLDRRKHKCGFLGGMYMLCYGIGRFAVEFLRNDHRGAVGPLSTSQFISLGFVAVAIFLFCRKEKPAAVSGAADPRSEAPAEAGDTPESSPEEPADEGADEE